MTVYPDDVPPEDGTVAATNEAEVGPGRLGRLPAKSDPRALLLARLAPKLSETPPPSTNFWRTRTPFPLRSFGNLQYGDCTRAKQANAIRRMERIETRRTPAIEDAEVVRAYLDMTDRLYGGGDTGAFETDALDCWRRVEQTIHDIQGRALTIDAYLRVNHLDQIELRSALALAGAHGLAICLNLPLAFQALVPPQDWDVPEGQALINEWMPGSWGGHSLWATDYDRSGLWLEHTWELPRQRLTWRAVAAYCDEAHIVIDNLDYWRTKKTQAAKALDLAAVRRAVNKVSSLKIA